MELAALEHMKSPYRFVMALMLAIVALWATCIDIFITITMQPDSFSTV